MRIASVNGLREVADRLEQLAREFRSIAHTTEDSVGHASDSLLELLGFAGVPADQELVEALEGWMPKDDPFVGDELSGGPACVGCGRDFGNADHDEHGNTRPGTTRGGAPSRCTWVRSNAVLAKVKESK